MGLEFYTWDTPNGAMPITISELKLADYLLYDRLCADLTLPKTTAFCDRFSRVCIVSTGKKISIALEEMELPHTLKPINIGSNVDQFTEGFKAISPNSKIPAIGACPCTSKKNSF